MPLFFDPTYIIVVPALLIAIYAQIKVSSTFNKYLKVSSTRGITGAQIARGILDKNGLSHVKLEMIESRLGDHYDPKAKTVRLSPDVYNGNSLSSIGVAAHETGHALQHDASYAPLAIRSGLFPLASFGSSAAWVFIILGMFFGAFGGIMIKIGIVLFSVAVLFQIVTLPVEFNASRRALGILTSEGYLADDEVRSTKKVLNAAAFTYVAAALVAVMQLVYLILGSDD